MRKNIPTVDSKTVIGQKCMYSICSLACFLGLFMLSFFLLENAHPCSAVSSQKEKKLFSA